MSSNSGSGSGRSERLNRDGQGRALSRIFNKIDLDFINQFAETGVDNGPEAPQKSRKISQRLERPCDNESESEQKFSGFAGMFKNQDAASQSPASKNALGGLFDPEPEEVADAADNGDENPYIRKRTDAKSRRGLYTGVLKRPVFNRPEENACAGAGETQDLPRRAVSDTMAIGEARPATAFKFRAGVPSFSHSAPGASAAPTNPSEQHCFAPAASEATLTPAPVPREDPLAPEATGVASEGKSPQGTVSFIKPDLAQLNALADSAKQRRIESRYAEEPVENHPISRADRKWARPGSCGRGQERDCPITGFLNKIKDLCARLSGLCHRRMD